MPDPTIPSTLFICYGNVARSQMAEGWFNHYTSSQRGFSAGTGAVARLFTHPTNEAIAVMAEEGIDISQHHPQPLTPDLAAQADRVVVLCKRSDCPDYLINHPNITFNEVEDPYGKTLDLYRSVREQIRLLIETLI
jgi:protein-tyrosine-phosphatase